MLSRTEAKQRVELYKQLFDKFLNKDLIMTFDVHTFQLQLKELVHSRASDFKLLDKREKPDGGWYAPQILHIKTSFDEQEDHGLYFVLEDINVISILHGIRIETAAGNIDFRLDRK